MRIKLLIIALINGMIVSCITPYEPGEIQDSAGVLVIEGSIIEPYGTVFKLSRTRSLNGDEFANITVGNTVAIHILSDRGERVATAEPYFYSPGTYIVNTEIHFEPGALYAAEFLVDGKRYQSSFVRPVQTPPIDDVTWITKNQGYEVEFRLSTHDPQNEVKYYRWAYEENWEYRSHYLSNYRWDPVGQEIIRMSLDDENTYYCWAVAQSYNLLLGSTDKLSESFIKDKPFLNLTNGSTRFDYLYSITVRQYGLSQEAYSYFSMLQSNIDDAGGLFAPQPTEMEGNIRCLDDPKEPVVGYINASTEAIYRVFIEANDVRYMGELPYDCGNPMFFSFSDLQDAYNMGYGLYEETAFGFNCFPVYCLDCRQRGGSKNKPDWWPNDHQ
jgi:hypothetical protein